MSEIISPPISGDNSTENRNMARKQKSEAAKAADFKRLAEKHTNTAIAALGRLSKLGNPAKYAHTPKQLEVIQSGLEKAASAALAAVRAGATATGGITL